jgi:hypothetical protein
MLACCDDILDMRALQVDFSDPQFCESQCTVAEYSLKVSFKS